MGRKCIDYQCFKNLREKCETVELGDHLTLEQARDYLLESLHIIQEYRAGVIRRARGFSKLYTRATNLIEAIRETTKCVEDPH